LPTTTPESAGLCGLRAAGSLVRVTECSVIGFSRSVIYSNCITFQTVGISVPHSMVAVRRAPSGAPVWVGFRSTNLCIAATFWFSREVVSASLWKPPKC
jgi:hypothetical protein